MAYIPTIWTDRAVQFVRRYLRTEDGLVYTFTPNEGTISDAGTPLNAANMNKIENQLVTLETLANNSAPYGTIAYFAMGSAPAGWLKANGSLLSMTSYKNLFEQINITFGLNAGIIATFDNTTDVVTSALHGLLNNDIIRLTNSGGSLPTNLSALTTYYVINSTANTFKLSLTQNGLPVDFTTDGTGTNRVHNQFALPDLRGEFLRGLDDSRGVDVGRLLGSFQQATSIGDNTFGMLQKLKNYDGTDGTYTANDVNVFNSYTKDYRTLRPRNIALLACIKY